MKTVALLLSLCLAANGYCSSSEDAVEELRTHGSAMLFQRSPTQEIDPQKERVERELAEQSGLIVRLLRAGDFQQALDEIDRWAQKSLTIGKVSPSYYRRRAEALIGLTRYQEALDTLAKTPGTQSGTNLYSKELALAYLDKLSNDDVNRMMKPLFEKFEKDDIQWRKTDGREIPITSYKYPTAFDKKSRIAAIRVLRASLMVSDRISCEREAREALNHVPQHAVAGYYLVISLEKQGKQKDAAEFLPIMEKMPGRWGYSARIRRESLERLNKLPDGHGLTTE